MFLTVVGKSFQIQEHSKTQFGKESASSGRFNPVSRLCSSEEQK